MCYSLRFAEEHPQLHASHRSNGSSGQSRSVDHVGRKGTSDDVSIDDQNASSKQVENFAREQKRLLADVRRVPTRARIVFSARTEEENKSTLMISSNISFHLFDIGEQRKQNKGNQFNLRTDLLLSRQIPDQTIISYLSTARHLLAVLSHCLPFNYLNQVKRRQKIDHFQFAHKRK